jgi:hypothetical protein
VNRKDITLDAIHGWYFFISYYHFSFFFHIILYYFLISFLHFIRKPIFIEGELKKKKKTESWKGIKREKSHQKLDFIGLDLIWIYIAISNPFITGKLGFKDGNNSFEA